MALVTLLANRLNRLTNGGERRHRAQNVATPLVRPILFVLLPSISAAIAHHLKARRRAAFWRKLGCPNFVLARAAKPRKREERPKSCDARSAL